MTFNPLPTHQSKYCKSCIKSQLRIMGQLAGRECLINSVTSQRWLRGLFWQFFRGLVDEEGLELNWSNRVVEAPYFDGSWGFVTSSVVCSTSLLVCSVEMFSSSTKSKSGGRLQFMYKKRGTCSAIIYMFMYLYVHCLIRFVM